MAGGRVFVEVKGCTLAVDGVEVYPLALEYDGEHIRYLRRIPLCGGRDV